VPPRKHREDFAFAFVPPIGGFEWDILPEQGETDGLTTWIVGSKGIYVGSRQMVPLDQNQLFMQSLPARAFNDGGNYLLWFRIPDPPKAVSFCFTFARLEYKNNDARAAIKKALGLGSACGPPIVNPGNHHTYILLNSGTWKNSEAHAVALGGHLATVRNQAEEDWLLKTFGNYSGAQRLLWIGLSDREKKFHFTWSSGESVSYTSWAKGEPNNAGRGEDFVAIYQPGHDQAGKWNDWSDRNHDPIGLTMNGVAEIIPSDEIAVAKDGSAKLTGVPVSRDANSAGSPPAVPITGGLIVTNDSGSIKLQWPVSNSKYMLEATTNLAEPFTMFGYSEITNLEAGIIYVTITNPVPQMFFRLREP
jgi:hypothetical protein